MKYKSFLLLSLSVLVLTLSSWGDVGHAVISLRIDLSFNQEMAFFEDWLPYLSEHASDADWRKKDDPEEGPKHYIDIDNYEGFVADGSIPQSLDDCIAEYGEDFVAKNGYLPWATLAMYDSVVNCLKRRDWDNGKKYAADLGHYVADGHMPMHLTRNYDGQFTGNKGIHYRYEIGMINKYAEDIQYTGSPAGQIPKLSDYVFSYMYSNYKYMDSILIADVYAKEMSSDDVESDLYYLALWERTENMTKVLFSKASHAFAELLYSAWIDAGRPSLIPASAKLHDKDQPSILVNPNPAKNTVSICYNILNAGVHTATIYDANGRITASFPELNDQPGKHSLSWNSSETENGTYFFVLKNNHFSDSKIILLSN